MKRSLLLLVASIILVQLAAFPVERAGWITLGISPSFLIEPYDEHANTVEINALPLTLEFGLSDLWAIEFRPILNLRFKPEEPVTVSHVGLTITTPRYLALPWLAEDNIAGILGPVITYTWNLQDKVHTVTLAGEVGVSSVPSPSWGLDAQAQAGATLFLNPREEQTVIVPHIGVFVIPGVRFPGG